jgi:hypothetical protein
VVNGPLINGPIEPPLGKGPGLSLLTLLSKVYPSKQFFPYTFFSYQYNSQCKLPEIESSGVEKVPVYLVPDFNFSILFTVHRGQVSTSHQLPQGLLKEQGVTKILLKGQCHKKVPEYSTV